MDNVSHGTYFTLDGHVEMQKYRYVYFAVTLTLYLLIIGFNSILISIVCCSKKLHEPMYVFLCALFCNTLFGTSAFYPKLLQDFLSDTQLISYSGCIVQAFVIYTYAASEFTLLSVMAYDRYVAICKPLQYNTIVTPSSVTKLLLFAWILPVCETSVMLSLTSRLTLFDYRLNRVYCDNYSIVKLSCENTAVNNIYGLFALIITVFPALFFIIFSYVRILHICLNSSEEYRRKALQTCLPHIVIFINFSVNSVFEIIHN
ncbi:olfactory receptor 6N1-like [Amia ocellicauda]|uniref:olfactory receptor 6N1-like n=1 Tax=Amia ocellicauda TaxID=2972642 RepID=UPI003464872C